MYLAFLGTTYGALHLASDLNVTSDKLVGYMDHGNKRMALGIAAVIMWRVLLLLDVSDMFRYVSAFGSINGPKFV